VTVVPPRTIPRTGNGKVRHDRLRAALATGDIGEWCVSQIARECG
jgi:hypothetical protein